jgi:hypothetical protein
MAYKNLSFSLLSSIARDIFKKENAVEGISTKEFQFDSSLILQSASGDLYDAVKANITYNEDTDEEILNILTKKKYFGMGRIIEKIILRQDAGVLIHKDLRSKVNKAEGVKMVKDNRNAIILSKTTYESAKNLTSLMIDINATIAIPQRIKIKDIYNNPLLKQGVNVALLDGNNVKLKIKPDLVNTVDGIVTIVDIKTINNYKDSSFKSKFIQSGYQFQLAFYSYIYCKIMQAKANKYAYILYVNTSVNKGEFKDRPFGVIRFNLDLYIEEVLEMVSKVSNTIKQIKQEKQ